MSLDNNQIKAVEFGLGPVLVTAGPGSGKTTVITHRIKFLIEHLNIPADKILVITFTKQASLQMSDRFNSLMKDEYTPVAFGTFHAIFYQIILSLVGSNNVNLIKEKEKYELLKNILQKYDNIKIENAYLGEIIKEFSMIKNKGIKLSEHKSILLDDDKFSICFNEYNNAMREAGKIDFDDMCVRCLELLKDNKNFLESWQERFKVILVDEFQDINPLQYEIVRLIGNKYKNVFAVGDEDQSIYSFRGASPGMMFKFLEDFKASQIFLSINYRCNEDIVEIASKLIVHNKNRFNKSIKANSESKGGLTIEGFETNYQEYEKVKDTLIQYKNSNCLEECAILYRTNAVPMNLLFLLNKNKIPFTLKEKPESLIDSFVIKDILAYFELANGNLVRNNLVKVMNKPNRYISREIVDRSIREYQSKIKDNKDFDINTLLRNSKDKNYLYRNIYLLKTQLEKLKTLNPYAGIIYILKVIDYESFLKKYAYDNGIKFEEYKEKVDFIKDFSKDYDTFSEMKEGLMLCEVMISQNNASKNNDKGVSIMTMHSSKGLEWDNVILPDIIAGNVPYKKAKTFEELEEERRLFYVAITRARKNLMIGYVDNRELNIHKSVFIKEITES